MFKKLSTVLTLVLGISLGAAVMNVSATPNISLPFETDFSTYDLGPIPEGTDGWYPSSEDIVIQDAVVNKSAQAVAIPVDCILSNRFDLTVPENEVWIRLDTLPTFYNGNDDPVVDEDVALMFYLNSDGNFVMRDGPATTGEWTTNTTFVVNTNGTEWVGLAIKEDFINKKWDLHARTSGAWTEIGKDLGFIDASIAEFTGFDIYSGSTTSYVEYAGAFNEPVLEEDSEVTPENINFILGSTEGAVFTFDFKGNELDAVKVGSTTLTENTDYEIDGSECTIFASFLNTQAVGILPVEFTMSAGEDLEATITVSEVLHSSLGYLPGLATTQTLTINNTFEYPAGKELTALYLTNALPAGWSIDTNSFTCSDTLAEAEWIIDSEMGNQLTFAILPVTTENPVTFTYDLIIPAAETGVKELYSTLGFRFVGDDDSTEGASQPNPLPINPATMIRVEDAADGTGVVVADQNLASGSSITVYAIARDANSNFVALVTPATFALSSKTLGVADNDLTDNNDGTADFKGKLLGTAVIEAEFGSLTKVPSGTITVTAGTATQVSVETLADGTGTVVPLQNLTAGDTLTVYAVERDAEGNFAGLAASPVWGITNETGGVVSSDLVDNLNGSATFTGHLIGSAIIEAASGALNKTPSGVITVTAGTAASLSFTVDPVNTVAGAAITPSVQVTALDAQGNVATAYVGNVTVAISNNAGPGTLSGTFTKAAVGGVATFADLSIDKVGTGYTLSANATGLDEGVSDTFDITAADAAWLSFTVDPVNTVAGAAIPDVTVTAWDAYTNKAVGFVGQITVAIKANPGTGTLSGTAQLNAAAGEATFTGLSIDKAGAGYTLSANATGLDEGISDTFDITAGTAAKLVFTSLETDLTAGTTRVLEVEVRDANDNLVEDDGIAVAFAKDSGAGTVTGLAGANTVGGIAQLTVTGEKVGSITIKATATGLDSDTTTFAVIVGAPAQIVLTTQPEGGVNGQLLLTQPVLEIQASQGNLIATDNTSTASVTIKTGTGGTLSGTTTGVIAQNGVITFTDLVMAGTVGEDYTLEFEVGSFTVESDPIQLLASAVATQTAPGYRSPAIEGLAVEAKITNDDDDFDHLVWTPVLPAGWQLNSVSGDGSPSISGSDIVFANPGSTEMVFTYTVDIPGNAAVSNQLEATVEYSYAGSDQTNTMAAVKAPIFRYHSSDYRSPTRRIDAQELSYVQTYWRVGGYKPLATTRDGYTAEDGYAGAIDPGLHSADYDGTDWEISSTEINRVLDYWRNGGYHVDLTEPDGYSTAELGPGPAKYMGLRPIVNLTGPETFVPGETVTLTATMYVPNGRLGALAWLSDLPEGWEVISVTGDGSPELQRGDAVCMAQLLPAASTAQIVLQAPATAEGEAVLGLTANVIVDGRATDITPRAVVMTAVAGSGSDANDDGSVVPAQPELIPVKAVLGVDFDGDGKADPGIYNENTGLWTVMLSGSGYAKVEKVFGGLGWLAIPGDYDGDGLADLAVMQLATGDWKVLLTGLGYSEYFVQGLVGSAGATPASADYDGDGIVDPSVLNSAGVLEVMASSEKYAQKQAMVRRAGSAALAPVGADYDGDGIADPGVYNTETGEWVVLLSSQGYAATTAVFGGEGWEAAPGDYDGDGLADPAIRATDGSGNWKVMLSSQGYRVVTEKLDI